MTAAELSRFREEQKPFCPIQMRTVGKLLNDLYMNDVIDITEVRGRYRKMNPDDQVFVLEGMDAVLLAALQAGIGEHGTFEGVERG